MTDNSFSDLQEAVKERPVIETEIEGPDGETYPLKVKDADPSELEEFEQRGTTADADVDEVLGDLWDEYLEEPDISPDDVEGNAWLDAITRGMLKAWGAPDEAIDKALAEVAVEGNPR